MTLQDIYRQHYQDWVILGNGKPRYYREKFYDDEFIRVGAVDVDLFDSMAECRNLSVEMTVDCAGIFSDKWEEITKEEAMEIFAKACANRGKHFFS